MKYALRSLAAALAVVCLANVALSGDDKKGDDKDFEKQFKEALEKYGAPGPEHKVLDQVTGKFEAKVKFYMKPGDKAHESKGTMDRKWALGKRYVLEHFKGEAMGQPFEGLGMWGFDRQKKKYFGAWSDSMSTSLQVGHGTYDKDAKTFTMTADFHCPLTDKDLTSKDVFRIVSDTEHVQEMYKGPQGSPADKMFKVMEITYTRVK